MVIVATEAGIDQRKAAAVFVHGLLGIQPLPAVLRSKKPAMELQLLFIMPSFMLKIHRNQKSWFSLVILPNMVSMHQVSQPKVQEALPCLSRKILES